MSSDLKTKVLEATDLYGLISEHVRLMASGGNHRGLCPFHQEKTPSFYVFHDHFHCFGCSAHGNAISFVMRIQGLSFLEALSHLASRAGIHASEYSSIAYQNQQKLLARQRDALQEAQKWFASRLWQQNLSSQAYEAKEYLLARKFSEMFLQNHGFGLASLSTTELFQYLKQRGFSEADLQKASLIAASQRFSKERYYDFFQRRITFPIYDHTGKLIAFAGRVYGTHKDALPKYKNSRYPKNQVLYGFYQAKKSFRQKKRAIVTEGYMDVLRMWQYGFNETVASQGTALTIEHLKALSRMVEKVILLFDGDQAGDNAVMRSLALSQQTRNLSLYCAQIPQGMDPDSFLVDRGREALEEILQKARPLMEVVVQKRLVNTDPVSVAGVIEKEFFPWIRPISSLQQETILRVIAQNTGLSDEHLWKELHKSSSGSVQAKVDHTPNPDHSLPKLPSQAWELLVHLYYLEPSEGADLQEELHSFVHQKLELEGFWLHCFLALLPKNQEQGYFEYADEDMPELFQNGEGFEILQTLKSSAARFRVTKRDQAIRRIMKVWHKQALDASISALTSKLIIAKEDPAFPREMVYREIQSLRDEQRSLSLP